MSVVFFFLILYVLLNVTDWGFCIAPDSFIFSCLIDGRDIIPQESQRQRSEAFRGCITIASYYFYVFALQEACVNIFMWTFLLQLRGTTDLGVVVESDIVNFK